MSERRLESLVDELHRAAADGAVSDAELLARFVPIAINQASYGDYDERGRHLGTLEVLANPRDTFGNSNRAETLKLARPLPRGWLQPGEQTTIDVILLPNRVVRAAKLSVSVSFRVRSLTRPDPKLGDAPIGQSTAELILILKTK